jgi:hypothetical protein
LTIIFVDFLFTFVGEQNFPHMNGFVLSLKSSVIVCVMLFFSSFSSSQVVFQKSFNTFGRHITKTNDNQFLITGTQENQLLLVKTTSEGETTWSKTYGNNSFKGGLYSQQTIDGGYISCGYSEGETVSANRIEVVKTDYLGNIEWNKQYGGPPFSTFIARQIKQTNDQGFILCGETGPPAIGNNIYVLKTNNVSDTLWSRKYVSEYGSKAYGIEQTSDGGYIIAGQITDSTDNYYYHSLIMKTNSVGDTIWTTSFGGLSDDYAYSVKELEDGYIIAGKTYSFGAGQSDIYLCKFSLDGFPLWFKTFGGSKWELVNDLKITNDGGFIIAGSSDSYCDDNTVRDIYIIKTDENGELQWSRVYGEHGYNESYSIEEVSDGYVILGSTSSNVYLIKTDLNGYSGCNDELIDSDNSTEEIHLFSIDTLFYQSRGIIDMPNIYVENYSIEDTIFCHLVETNELRNKKDIYLSPNPTSGIFEIISNEDIPDIISVYDVSGKPIMQYNTGQSYINISDLKSGIYLVRINGRSIKIVKY